MLLLLRLLLLLVVVVLFGVHSDRKQSMLPRCGTGAELTLYDVASELSRMAAAASRWHW